MTDKKGEMDWMKKLIGAFKRNPSPEEVSTFIKGGESIYKKFIELGKTKREAGVIDYVDAAYQDIYSEVHLTITLYYVLSRPRLYVRCLEHLLTA